MQKRPYLILAILIISLVFGNLVFAQETLTQNKTIQITMNKDNPEAELSFTIPQDNGVVAKMYYSLLIKSSQFNVLDKYTMTVQKQETLEAVEPLISGTNSLRVYIDPGNYVLKLNLKSPDDNDTLDVTLEALCGIIVRNLTIDQPNVTGKTKIITGKITGVSEEANANSTAKLCIIEKDGYKILSQSSVNADGTFCIRCNLLKIMDNAKLGVFVDTNTNEFGSTAPMKTFQLIGVPEKVKLSKRITSKTSKISGTTSPRVSVVLKTSNRIIKTVRTDKNGKFSTKLNLKKVKSLNLTAVRVRNEVRVPGPTLTVRVNQNHALNAWYVLALEGHYPGVTP